MPQKFFFEGKKVSLRPVELEDAEFLAYCYNSPDVRETFFTNFPTNSLRQEEIIKDLYKGYPDYVPFIICERETGRAVGLTAFHRLDPVNRAAIYSIIIPDKSDWGKNYGTEATQLMVSYGFEILNLNRIQLHVYTGNTRAIKAYERAGFTREGLLRQAMYHYDQYCDFYVMALLREEYYQNKKQNET